MAPILAPPRAAATAALDPARRHGSWPPPSPASHGFSHSRNKGARSAGVDGKTAYAIEVELGSEVFCGRLRERLKTRSFVPVLVRERMIPKADGKKRRLGIATVADRVVQASLKLVLEPIFEADFLPCSYGFVCPEQEGSLM